MASSKKLCLLLLFFLSSCFSENKLNISFFGEPKTNGAVTEDDSFSLGDFNGLDSVVQEDATSATLSWSHNSQCDSYEVREVAPSSRVLQTVPAPTESFLASSLSADGSYEFSLKCINSDGSEDDNTITRSLMLSSNARAVYRSLGFNETSALESGGSNSLDIVSGTATFGSGLALNVGVGDVIQYDENNDGVVSSIAFISERVSSTQYNVQAIDGTAPVDTIFSDQDWSIYRAYTGLSDFSVGTENSSIEFSLRDFDSHTGDWNLVTSEVQLNLALYADAALPGSDQLNLSGSWITSQLNSIRIFSPHKLSEVGESQRHLGIYRTDRFHVDATLTGSASILNVGGVHVEIEGLQFNVDFNSGSSNSAIVIADGVRDSYITIRDSIFRSDGSGASDLDDHFIDVREDTSHTTHYTTKIHNNIFYGLGTGSAITSRAQSQGVSQAKVFSNTFYNTRGAINSIDDSVLALNNLAQSCLSTCLSGSFNVSSDYNATSDTSASGASSLVSVSASFRDALNSDYRLSQEEALLRDVGIDLSTHAQLSFSNDVMGHKRKFDWDIGAYEIPTIIYRSIGPSGTLAAGGANALSITETTATFADADVADNVGVGDAIQYDSGSGSIDAIAFITRRNGPRSYELQAADGALPIGASITQNWDIFRAYRSSFSAESLNENGDIHNSVEDFEIILDGTSRDIVLENEAFYYSYYDSGGGTRAVWDKHQTSDVNIIKFYSPYLSTEVGVSQRHSGKWDDSKARIRTSMSRNFYESLDFSSGISRHVHIEGLQFYYTADGSNHFSVMQLSSDVEATYVIKNNIFRGEVINGAGGAAIYTVGSANPLSEIYFINNLVYGFSDSTGTFGFEAATVSYLYNNTFYNNDIHIDIKGNYGVFKNNIFQKAVEQSFDSLVVGAGSTKNIMDGAQELGGSSQDVGVEVNFISTMSEDFRLSTSDVYAKADGADLSSDSSFNFLDDIRGMTRSTWDIGAFAYYDVGTGLTAYNAFGTGASDDPYLIFTKEQLKDISVSGCSDVITTACGSDFVLSEAIDLEGDSLFPIGQGVNDFSGSIKGNNMSISNFSIASTNGRSSFIGRKNGGLIENLNLDNVSVISSNDYTGVLIGTANGGIIDSVHITNSQIDCSGTGSSIGGLMGRSNGSTIQNSSAGVDINGTCRWVGGLVGINDNGSILNSFATGNIKGTTEIGGLVGAGGHDLGVISGVYATGDVYATGLYSGGLFGAFTRGTLRDCFALGDVYSTSGYAGGLVGSVVESSDVASIENCYAVGDVRASLDNVGGLVGTIEDSCTISHSFSHGNVDGGGDNVGGLAGRAINTLGSISDSYSTSNVKGSNYVGGLVGLAQTPVENSYARGSVYASVNYAGGLIGSTTDTVSLSYAENDVIGSTHTGGLIGHLNGGSVSKSYAKTSTNVVNGGGLIGVIENTASVNQSYALGTLTGSTIGAFAESVSADSTVSESFIDIASLSGSIPFIQTIALGSTLSNNFWNQDSIVISGGGSAGEFEGKTTRDLRNKSIMETTEGWDFVSTWAQLDSRSYPVHKQTYTGSCIDNPSANSYLDIGTGTQSDPYVVCHASQLKSIQSNDMDGHYVLGADIDLKRDEFSSFSIGDSSPFLGVFDCQNHEIKNLYSNAKGLMSSILNGVVKNCGFQGALLESSSTASTHSIVSAYIEGGYVLNNYAIGVVDRPNSFSSCGIVGKANPSQNRPAVISKNSFTGSLAGRGSNAAIIGRTENENFSNKGIFTISNKANASLDIDAQSGIISGTNFYTRGLNFVKKSFAAGSITGTAWGHGGIIGQSRASAFQNYSSANITGFGRIGGIAGYSYPGTSYKDNYVYEASLNGMDDGSFGGLFGYAPASEIDHNYVISRQTGAAATPFGGAIGNGRSSNAFDNFWDIDFGITGWGDDQPGDANGSYNGLSVSAGDFKNSANFTAWDMTNIWVMANGDRAPILRWQLHPVCQANMSAMTYSDIGVGSASDPYLICFKEQLNDIGENGCNGSVATACSSHFKLLNDIDLKGFSLTPISSDGANVFDGVFDGSDNTIYNFRLLSSSDRMGLFRTLDGTIKNLKLIDAEMDVARFGGLLVGDVSGTGDARVENVEVEGVILGTYYLGGIIGHSSNANLKIKNVKSRIKITGTGYAGGVISGLDGVMENAYASGSIDISGTSGGGIAADGSGTIIDAHANVNISGGSNIGGLTGEQVNEILSSSAIGDVTGTSSNVGGLVGRVSSSSAIKISQSFYRSGSVVSTGGDNVGGLIGLMDNTGGAYEISENFAAAELVSSSGSNAHGFIGIDTAAAAGVSQNYWDNSKAFGADSSGEYEGLSTVLMQDNLNFIGWDDVNTWHFSGIEYPTLISIP